MLRVGLTGGIACGKSHVLARLSRRGFHALDLDRVAHELMAPGSPAHREVVEAFGAEVVAPDGRIDRKVLGTRVFADAGARSRLNAIVHPRVREEEARRCRALADHPTAVIVTDAALLVESGVHLRFDRIVVVHCREQEQLRRLMARDGLDAASARARLAAQMPVQEKRAFAHYEVDTNGSMAETDASTDAVAATLGAVAGSPPPRAPVPLEKACGAIGRGPRLGPRGLDPVRLVSELAREGLDLERLARKLEPPPGGAWYRAARPSEPGPGPEALAAPLVLWAIHRRGSDEDFLASAAASLARLTHVQPDAIADAVLFALALHAAILHGGPVDSREAWSRAAARWAGSAPSGRLDAVLSAARRHPTAVSSAPVDRGPGTGLADLAGALSGAATGAPPSSLPPRLVADLEALGFQP